MSNDWQPGDLALCVDTPSNSKGAADPRQIGAVYTVRLAVPIRHTVGLAFIEIQFGGCLTGMDDAANYIKVTPPEADEFDREVIDLMQKQGEDA